jgi:cobalt-zinc-cadmium efflux system outer membrane protein
MRVQTDVRMAFYSALIAQRQLGVADELVAIARAGVKAAQEVEKGTATGRNDVLEAQIELRSAEIQARTSYYRHVAAWRILSAVVGDPDLPFAELDGDLFLPEVERDWNDVVGQLKASSPEFAAAIVHVEETRLALARATAEKIPNMTVDGLVNWRDNGIGGDPDGGLQVTFPVPLWNRNRGAVAQAAAEIKSAEQHVEQLRLDLHRQLAEVFERYSVTYFQGRYYRDEILPAAQEALDLTTKNFRAGAVDYNDLLTSQRTYANANLAYLNALRELWIAEAELDGLLLTGSLNARE